MKRIEGISLRVTRGLSILFIVLLLFGCSGGGSSGGDDAKASGESGLSVSILNPPSDVTIIIGSTLSFSGRVSGGNEQYTYLWTFDGAAPSSDLLSTGNVTFTTEGTYTVKFKATDGLGNSDEKTVTVTVIKQGNSEPVAHIDSPDKEIILTEGQKYTFQGSVSGGKGILTYKWDFNGGAAASTVEDPGEVTFTTPGTYTVTFTATDSEGKAGTATVKVTVTSGTIDTQPIAEIGLEAPWHRTNIGAGDQVDFSGTVTSGNAPFTSYQWDFGNGSVSTDLNPGRITYSSEGVFTVTFTVRDADGDVASDTLTITVGSGFPTVLIAQPSTDYMVYQGIPVHFEGSVSGGNQPLSYQWNFKGAAPDSTELIPGDVVFNTVGEFDIDFTAKDAGNDSQTDTVRITVFPKDDFSLVNQLLREFRDDPTEANYGKIMQALAVLDSANKAVNLYKGLAELLDVYNSPVLADILTKAGLTLGIETDYEDVNLQNMMKDAAYSYLMNQPYVADGQAFLAEAEARLARVDANLANAEDLAEIRVLFGDLDYVDFDTIDVQVLRATVNAAKAMIIYLQSVNYNITNHTIIYKGSSYDIRSIATGQVDLMTGDTLDSDKDEYDQALWQLFVQNDNLLTYSDTTKLSSFKATLEAACVHYSNAVTSLAGMDETARRARNTHAFNLDTDLSVRSAVAVRDEVIPSIMDCLEGTTNQYTLMRLEYTGQDWADLDPEDDFWYNREFQDIYLDHYCFDSGNSTDYDISLSALLSGAKSPRDAVIETHAFAEKYEYLHDDGDPLTEEPSYEPYTICGEPVLYAEDVAEIDWEEMVESFNIPYAGPTIDLTTINWSAIEIFRENESAFMKLVRDDTHIYIAVASKGIPYPTPSAPWSWDAELNLRMWSGNFGEDDWDTFGIYCDYTMNATGYAPPLTPSVYFSMSDNNVAVPFDENNGLMTACVASPTSAPTSVTCKFLIRTVKLDRLLKQGSVNYYSLSASGTGTTGSTIYSRVKLLPEFSAPE